MAALIAPAMLIARAALIALAAFVAQVWFSVDRPSSGSAEVARVDLVSPGKIDRRLEVVWG